LPPRLTDRRARSLAWLTSDLFAKRLELVRKLVPAAALIGALFNPKEFAPRVKEIETAARTVGRQIKIVNASSESDFDAARVVLPVVEGSQWTLSDRRYETQRTSQIRRTTVSSARVLVSHSSQIISLLS
jgi:ABC-type uncharacterized transport system substrate-binding protein